MAPGATQTGFLPDIKGNSSIVGAVGNGGAVLVRTNSKGSVRTSNTMSTDLSHFKKASPEALALMMKNLKNNNKGSKQAWVPGGQNLKKDPQAAAA